MTYLLLEICVPAKRLVHWLLCKHTFLSIFGFVLIDNALVRLNLVFRLLIWQSGLHILLKQVCVEKVVFFDVGVHVLTEQAVVAIIPSWQFVLLLFGLYYFVLLF